MSKTSIKSIVGRRVWNSHGQPTIEVEVTLRYGASGRAIAPSGAFMATGEAVSLDVEAAIHGVYGEIAKALKGEDAADQQHIDRVLIDLDATADKSRLGGNAMIATSLATAQAAAADARMPLWQYLRQSGEIPAPTFLPLPEVQIFGSAANASGGAVDVQDYMIIPTGADSFVQALDWSAAVTHAAADLMAEAGTLRGVTDQGGLWPNFQRNEDALDLLLRAIEAAGLAPGRDMCLSLDIAASRFGAKGKYHLHRDGQTLDSDGLSGLLVDWIERYPIVSIEDPLAEGDKEGMIRFTWAVGKRVQVVGDDSLITKATRIRAAGRDGACNAVLINPGQAGTLSETLAALTAAGKAGLSAIASARSGDSEDTGIVHLAAGWDIPQIKVGAIMRGERTAKWNEGLRIAEAIAALGGEGADKDGPLPPASSFPWAKR